MAMRAPAGFISAFYDPLKNPDAPFSVSASSGDSSASVSFTAPSNIGGSAITAYYAVSNPGQITATAASSPVSVTGLSNGTSYTFNVWALNSYGPGVWSTATGSVTPSLPIGIFAGGYTPSYVNNIDYVTISSAGNATNWGQLTVTVSYAMAAASSSRGLVAAGLNGSGGVATIGYITFASAGNAVTFGNMTNISSDGGAGSGSSTRGIFAGAGSPVLPIDYVTFATTGNSSSFGNLTLARTYLSSVSSPTRGIWAGGYNSGGSPTSRIDYVTIATTGNASTFGSLTQSKYNLSGSSNSTLGLVGGGWTTTRVSSIDYITIATTGNGTSFGNLSVVRETMGACSSTTQALWGGGYGPFATSSILYTTIATSGSTSAFGNLTAAREQVVGCSNASGGVQ